MQLQHHRSSVKKTKYDSHEIMDAKLKQESFLQCKVIRFKSWSGLQGLIITALGSYTVTSPNCWNFARTKKARPASTNQYQHTACVDKGHWHGDCRAGNLHEGEGYLEDHCHSQIADNSIYLKTRRDKKRDGIWVNRSVNWSYIYTEKKESQNGSLGEWFWKSALFCGGEPKWSSMESWVTDNQMALLGEPISLFFLSVVLCTCVIPQIPLNYEMSSIVNVQREGNLKTWKTRI